MCRLAATEGPDQCHQAVHGLSAAAKDGAGQDGQNPNNRAEQQYLGQRTYGSRQPTGNPETYLTEGSGGTQPGRR